MPLLSLSVSQLLLAFVAASILHRLTYSCFFLKWLASHKFVCYLAPSNQELKRLKDNDDGKKSQLKQKNRAKKQGVVGNEGGQEVFKIAAADLDVLKLDKSIIGVRDLELLSCSVDLEWIVDLALMSLFSFTLTEIQFYFYPQTKESNFSLLWALLVIVYCIKILWKLTTTYFKNKDMIGERSICIVSGCTFLLVSMIVLTTDENRLELGLENAYLSFNKSATTYVNNHTLISSESRPVTRPISFILVKFFIAILCSIIGLVFTFPGLRFGQLHKALIESENTSKIMHIIYSINYLSPLLIVCLWIKPISRNILLNQNLIPIDNAVYDTIRIYCIVIANLVKFFLLPKYVAVFLSSSILRISRIRQRGGSTTNREIQLTVSSIYGYFNVVVIQYILPILMCLFTALMFKALGDYNWLPFSNSTISIDGEGLLQTNASIVITNDLLDDGGLASNNLDTSKGTFSISSIMVNFIEFKKIFSSDVARGLFGFTTWWLHFSWFATSTAGIVYHTYFTHH